MSRSHSGCLVVLMVTACSGAGGGDNGAVGARDASPNDGSSPVDARIADAALPADAASPSPDAASPPPDAALEPGPPDPLAAPLADLAAVSARPIEFAVEDGLPVFVSMQVEAPGWDLADRAFDFLEIHAGFFGFDAPREALFPARIGDDEADFVAFAQHRGGIPVIGAYLGVHFEGEDITSVSGHWLRDFAEPGFPETNSLTATVAALASFSDTLTAPETTGEPRLVYLDRRLLDGEDTRVHLAWESGVVGRDARGGLRAFRVYVDAHDGAVLLRRTYETDADRPGEDFDIEVHGSFYEADFVGTTWRPFVLPVSWFDEDGPLDSYPAGGDPDGAASNDHIHSVYHHWFDTFGYSGLDGDDLEVVVHDPDSAEGLARYTAFTEQIRFYDGWVLEDVFAHEFTHGVDDHQGDLDYARQSGALDESFADVFGALVDDDDWTIGEDRDADGDGVGEGLIRDLSQPLRRNQPDHMRAELSTNGVGYRQLRGSDVPADCDDEDPDACNDYGWVHSNSGIPNKAAWMTIEGGLHNGYQTRGLGRGKGNQLYYRVLTRHLGESSKFADARRELIEVASSFARSGAYGFEPLDVCDVVNAWASVGVGTGDADCDGVADDLESDDDHDFVGDARDVCPVTFDPGQLDTDGDSLGDACDLDDDNDGGVDTGDNCPTVFNDQADADFDGIGDLCEDADADGIYDVSDNCPQASNPRQADFDGDGLGDPCDEDRDADGIPERSAGLPGASRCVGGAVAGCLDNCPTAANADQNDVDRDGVGTRCDNCHLQANPDQVDADGDLIGDVCDQDNDNDGITDAEDNCRLVANPDLRPGEWSRGARPCQTGGWS